MTLWEVSVPGPKPTVGGHVLRAWQRRKNRSRIESVIVGLLDTLDRGLRAETRDLSIPHDKFQSWLNNVEARLPPSAIQIARRFLHQSLSAGIRRLGWTVEVPPNLIRVADHPPLLRADTVKTGNRIHPILDQWGVSLDDADLFAFPTGNPPPDVHRLRAGQLLVGMILLGGMLHSTLLVAFADSFPREFQVHGEWAWTDIYQQQIDPSARQLVRRCITHGVCELLLLAWTRQGLGPLLAHESAGSRDPCWSAIRRFLDKYSPGHGMGSLAQFIRCARAFTLPLLDSVLYRVSRWDLRPTPLAPQAWWRLISGKALDGFEPSPSPAQPLEGARFVPREPLAVDIARRKSSLAALREIQHILSPRIHPRKEFADGTILYPDQSKKLSGENLRHLIRYIDDNGHRLYPIVYYLACWAQHMLTYGTRAESSRHAATIHGYFCSIARFLIDVFGEHDPAQAGEEAFVAAYTAVLDETSPASMAGRLGRLIDFHAFLEDQFICAQILDWDAFDVPPSDCANVRANLLTPKEYRHALTLLSAEHRDTPLTERGCLMAQAFLVLAFRFGPRLDEATLLRMSDISLHGNVVIVSVRKSDYQRLKTPNGNRRIEIRERLDEQELRILRVAIGRRIEELHWRDPDALLLGDPQHPTQPLPSQRLAEYVVAVLRHVSGDPTISAHTLRHGFATFQSYQSHLNGMPPYMADLLTGWIGHCEAQSLDRNPGSLSRRSLWEVTDQIGHGSINTTFASYVHLADVELGGALACIPVRLKLSALENLTGMPAKSLHKAAERANRNPIEEALRRTRKATELANPDLPYKLRDPDTQVAIQLPAAHDQPNESEFNPTDVCWTILLCRANMLPSRVARRLRIPIAHVDRWNAGQNWLLSLLTVRGAKRHGELFRVRHAYSSSENAMLSSLQAGLAARDRQLLEGLWLHARYKTRGLSYVDLAQPDDARKYIAWLIRLGIPAQDIEIQPGRERRTALFTLATTYPGIVIATDDEIAHASTGVPSAGVVRLFVRLSLHTGSAQPGVRAQQYSTEHYWLLHMALVYVFCDLQSLGWA